MRKLFALAWFAAAFVYAHAADHVFDLGQGLSYVRVHSLPLDAATVNSATAKALIVDLRRVETNDTAAKNFIETLGARTAHTQLFVLVGPLTPRDLTKAIQSASVKLLTLGIALTKPDPCVEVQGTPTMDHTAYEALESGTPIEKLISGKIEKERYDEATLVEEFKNGHVSAPPADDIPDPPADETKKEPAPVIIDRVLQRAVHLHRSLQVLKR